MPDNSAVVLFTAKSAERIIREGGTSSWRLDRNNARRCSYAICVRNARSAWGDGTEQHHLAFLIGKVSDVVRTAPTPENSESPEERYLIMFSEYAHLAIPDSWPKGFRNPVRYSTLDELGIDPEKLTWAPMPELREEPSTEDAVSAADGKASEEVLTILQAKKGLALTFGVPPESIEIIIRG